ncbi:MAG: GyrI-like domain-containing protein [Ferruginibacter sp.]
MKVEIINNPLEINIYGFEGIAINKDYTGTAFRLSGKMWETVKTKAIKNKGKNIWVYDNDERVFAGIELDDIHSNENGLEHKMISLNKYAYYKHVGPYGLIKQAGLNMKAELKSRGYETTLPYIEIYGHWTNDETKTETELFMSLK